MKTFAQLVLERGPKCECGCKQDAQDRHHGLIPQLKRGGAILDNEVNLFLVSHHEHVAKKKFDNPEWRHRFYEISVKRYGSKVGEWIAEVKATTKLHKSRFEFMKG